MDKIVIGVVLFIILLIAIAGKITGMNEIAFFLQLVISIGTWLTCVGYSVKSEIDSRTGVP